jgi:dUTP pyrophosphatase
MGLLLPRSSCAQEGWSVESPPIDSSYRGEIHAMLHNRGQKTWRINTGDRIVQLVIVPCLQIVPEFVSELSSTERGANGFGSTGKGLRIAGNSG